ncbi:unnamed protein product [Protopolystoma xenopodis]|uniref:Uncharacterized protein n=1 Tax=Protopolystoma xenopodis TaxID=117903 RepID=A0A3S5ADJ8_9PLAT|nr:unnamed protein product [Protopolystoma xenopodis]
MLVYMLSSHDRLALLSLAFKDVEETGLELSRNLPIFELILTVFSPPPRLTLADILGPLLRGRQSLQTLPHLHFPSGHEVQGQASRRDAASHLLNFGQRLSQHATR